MTNHLLDAQHLVVEYAGEKSRRVQAVSDVSISIAEGETLGLVGESGCGKSTLGRALLQAPRPTAGSVVFDGIELTKLRGNELRAIRPRMQLVLQDPMSALNPRRRIADIVAEPLRLWQRGRAADHATLVGEALQAVGLDLGMMAERRPFELSGGQCQRVNIARALVLEPKLLVCDEPVSALDVSVRAQILNLLHTAKARFRLTMLFIGHDLAVVKNISDRIAVMYLGQMCEIAAADDLYRSPAHPYTAALLASVPEPEPPEPGRSRPRVLAGELPSPIDPPSGCRFRTRCPRATALCADEQPVLRSISAAHSVACHHPLWSPELTGAPGGPTQAARRDG